MKKVKTAVDILIIVLGAVLFAFAAAGKLDNFFCGYGAGLAAVGAIRIYRKIKYEKNPEYAQKVKIENSDERNVFLMNKAKAFALNCGCIILAAAVLMLRIAGYGEYSTICGYICCLYLMLYVIAYFAYRKTC